MYRWPSRMPKFFIKTYGCQMNERDSEQVARSLLDRGYEAAANEAEADVVLLNTCSVRDMAEQKALGKMGMLGRMAKQPAGGGLRFSRLHGAGARRGIAQADAARRSRRRHAKISSRRGLRRGTARTKRARWTGDPVAPWTIRASRSSTRRRRAARRKRFANTRCGRGRRRPSFPSCRAATCIAPFASCRGRAARSAAARSRRS